MSLALPFCWLITWFHAFQTSFQMLIAFSEVTWAGFGGVKLCRRSLKFWKWQGIHKYWRTLDHRLRPNTQACKYLFGAIRMQVARSIPRTDCKKPDALKYYLGIAAC